jgi:gamma-glutamyltranspeptidase / glutathione hydrolase
MTILLSLLVAVDGGLVSTAKTPAHAKHGMVAAAHPAAVEAGLKVLQSGGNAVDAAIAVNAMLAVVEPMSCGMGGDLFAIVWDAKTKKLYGLNASGRSPYAASAKLYRERGLKMVPEYGALAVTVPGCVDGWDQLRKRFGTKSFAETIGPAVEAAESGFLVPPVIGQAWRSSARMLGRDPDCAAAFLLPSGRAPGPGSMMTNKRMAATLKQIIEGGRDAYYKGPLTDAIVAALKKQGGLFVKRDFEEHTSTWVEPIGTDYRGVKVWQLPPNGQGLAVLEMLNILAGYDLKAMGHNSPEFAHLFVEAKKLAYADRAAYYADMDFEKNLPIAELATRAYGDRQRKRIDLMKAAMEVEPGDPRLATSETTYLTVVDKDRNAVSLIQSNYMGFGSRVMAGELGFMFQNRGALFSLDEKHPNRLEPHKRPFHTIIPGMATKDGKPWFSFGVMGGDMQPQGHVQVLVNLIDHGMDPQAAGAAARIRHDGSSSPTGEVMKDGGTVVLEPEISKEVADSLNAKGHKVTRGRASAAFGGYQGILIDDKTGELIGGSEPRKDGYAKGY